MKKLIKLRNRIDQIDNSIISSINERANITMEIGRLKSKSAKPVFSPVREAQVYDRLIRANKAKKGNISDKYIRSVYREIMSGSLALQTPLVIAYLGPEATFTHIAALDKFGKSLDYLECDSITEVFTEVERGRASYGVVPIENSTEGAVNHTLDMFIDSDLQICSESYLPIVHNLLSKRESIAAVKLNCNVYSHHQVLAQCRMWLEKNLPHAKLIPCASTTEAAKILEAKKGKHNDTAIASKLAAERYSLNILARSIEDSPHNITRFLVIGKQQEEPTKNDKTSVVFSMKDKAGALHDVLAAFKRSRINLTKIESRPSKAKAWKYYFFVDMQGHIKDKSIKLSLKQLQKHCNYYKLLGSYPAA
ncbi:MAG: prephenate dehydratase [Candidatus Omnitrophota bacterium]